MNKKAQENALIGMVVFGIIALILIGGALVLGLGAGVLTYTSDIFNEATAGLGDIAGTNMTQVQEMTVGTLNETIQMSKWFSTFILIFSFLGLLIFAFVIRSEPRGWLIGIYFVVVIILIIASVFTSNMYEDFHNGTDEIALELQSMVATSFMIIYLPHLIVTIAFIGGIIMFSGGGEFA